MRGNRDRALWFHDKPEHWVTVKSGAWWQIERGAGGGVGCGDAGHAGESYGGSGDGRAGWRYNFATLERWRRR